MGEERPPEASPVAPAAMNGNGHLKATDITMRWTAISAVWGLILIGVGCIFTHPHYAAGVTLVLGTLTGLLGNIIGGKLGLSKPNGSPRPTGS